MIRPSLLLTAAVGICAMADVPVAKAQMSVSVQTDGTLVAIDLNTVQVLVPPQSGAFDTTPGGLVYTAGGDGEDSFAFVADHAFLDVPVTFVGEVFDGVVELGYQYSTKDEEDDGNGAENPDGTITVEDDSGTTVTGEIIQEPGAGIDFPDGTVVIGTDDSIDNDIAIIDSNEGSEIHTHDDVSSLDEVAEILEEYPDDSITAIVLVGHGSGGGVSIDTGDDLDGQDIADGDHQDLIDLLDEKLDEDATIYILGCDQFDEDDAQYIQDLANETGHPVVANEDSVVWPEDGFYGEGHWVEVTPEEEDPEEEPAEAPAEEPAEDPAPAE